MKTRTFLLVLAVLYLSLFAVHAAAAPKAQSGEECFYAADIAITARALILESIPDEKIYAVLGRMYQAQTAPEWMAAIVPSAKADKRSAGDYAQALYNHCVTNKGRMDNFFGVRL